MLKIRLRNKTHYQLQIVFAPNDNTKVRGNVEVDDVPYLQEYCAGKLLLRNILCTYFLNLDILKTNKFKGLLASSTRTLLN